MKKNNNNYKKLYNYPKTKKAKNQKKSLSFLNFKIIGDISLKTNDLNTKTFLFYTDYCDYDIDYLCINIINKRFNLFGITLYRGPST